MQKCKKNKITFDRLKLMSMDQIIDHADLVFGDTLMNHDKLNLQQHQSPPSNNEFTDLVGMVKKIQKDVSASKSSNVLSSETADTTMSLRLEQLSLIKIFMSLSVRNTFKKACSMGIYHNRLEDMLSQLLKLHQENDSNLAFSHKNHLRNVKLYLKHYRQLEEKLAAETFRRCTRIVEFENNT